MGIEIERRFLVDGRNEKPWRTGKSSEMVQFYLADVSHIDGKLFWNGIELIEEDRAISNIVTWRIRQVGEEVVMAAKGRRIGAVATEYEWDLPFDLYKSLPLNGLPTIHKTRHYWTGKDGLLWEVDEYEGEISGLIIAEVELEEENQDVIIPDWVGMELTHLPGWSNSSLSMMIKDSEQN